MEPWSSMVVRSQKARLPSVAALHRNSLLGARKGQWVSEGDGKQKEPPPGPRRAPMQPLSPPLVGCLMGKGMDLEDTPLVVEGFSQELQPPPQVLQKEEPGGRRVAQLRTHSGQPSSPCLLAQGPQLSPHCSITAGCSHKGAKARPVELTHS